MTHRPIRRLPNRRLLLACSIALLLAGAALLLAASAHATGPAPESRTVDEDVQALKKELVDLNRDPAGKPLYPGADNTEVCPTSRFDKEPVYQEGKAPDQAAITKRVERYWRPYHDALRTGVGIPS